MRKGEVSPGGAQGAEPLQGLAVEGQSGWAFREADHLHIPPANAPAPARAQGLQRGFLGGETGGETRRRIFTTLAEGGLSLGEDSPGHAGVSL